MDSPLTCKYKKYMTMIHHIAKLPDNSVGIASKYVLRKRNMKQKKGKEAAPQQR